MSSVNGRPQRNFSVLEKMKSRCNFCNKPYEFKMGEGCPHCGTVMPNSNFERKGKKSVPPTSKRSDTNVAET